MINLYLATRALTGFKSAKFSQPIKIHLYDISFSIKFLLIGTALSFLFACRGFSQTNQPGINGITTYVNPILPGDHPDQTLLRVGKDFYSTGSNFHFTPYLPILHSTDLMHWEVIARVIPSTSGIPSDDSPSAGTWQGALAYFNNKYWVYFSNNAGGGQYFCTASDPKGPWSAPVRVNGVYGYDNSIFVDDDGTPYMLMKNGQDNNGIQKLGMNGQPSGPAMNLNWVNSNGHPYSWAEGPVMCKRNGRYYYFVAGNVTGGQYVLSTSVLTADETKWTRHGNFWQNATSSGGFTGPNHVTQPIKLDDGTWWCLSHAYDNDGWGGQGRQSHLHQVIWDANGVPKGIPVNTNPVAGPNLPSSDIMYEFIKSDDFESGKLSLNWHFLNKSLATKYTLTERPGFMRLKPGSGTAHILQKDKGKYYSLTTKIDFNATANGQQAGLRLTSGDDGLYCNIYSGYNNGKKIGISFNGSVTEVNNSIGNVLWLRVERSLHNLTGYYSSDGLTWNQIGSKDVSGLDKSQPDYNQWVGTSVGLFATGATADFDQFSYRYGFVPIKVEGRNNWFGVTYSNKTPGRTVTNSTSGDWLMLAGVDMGSGDMTTGGIEVNVASARSNSSLEIWLDNIGGNGTKVATIAIPNTGGTDSWKNGTASFTASGQHDLYLRFIGGANAFYVNTIKCLPNTGPIVSFTSPVTGNVFIEGNPITLTATATSSKGAITDVKFYDGTTLLSTDNSAPYSYSWFNATVGSHTVKAVATDNQGKTGEASITIKVNVPQGSYNGNIHQIPGTIQVEEYDLGGNGFAYYDDSPGSETGVAFRSDEDVDIEACTDAGGGYNLGWATLGEWLEYTVDVKAAGTYDLDLRVACNGDGRTISVTMDGKAIASDIAIPNTTDWQTWTTTTVKNVTLKTGKQIMRITIGGADYINLNYVAFKAVNVSIPPTVSLTAPANNGSFTMLETVTLTATASDADGTVASVQFYDDTTLLGTDNTAPFSFDWSGMKPGSHTLTAVATDNKGITTTSAPISITITAVQAPYKLTKHTIPGRIEVEEYDLGGEGLGYHEANTNGNEGGANLRNDQVDIETTGDVDGNYNIAYIMQGEWLEYTVDVLTTDVYGLNLRVAADGDGKAFHIEMDGTDISGSIAVPNTGGWQTWQTVSLNNINLTEGEHVMRIAFDSDYMNLNYVEFTGVITSIPIPSSEKSGIVVYPNPFTSEGALINTPGNFTYTITDISGLLLESGKGSDKKAVGKAIAPGVYFIKVNGEVFKVIKEE